MNDGTKAVIVFWLMILVFAWLVAYRPVVLAVIVITFIAAGVVAGISSVIYELGEPL